jgi:hypothetical protein
MQGLRPSFNNVCYENECEDEGGGEDVDPKGKEGTLFSLEETKKERQKPGKVLFCTRSFIARCFGSKKPIIEENILFRLHTYATS